ncbi:hypothetical protein BS78_02G017700 [Paspalum vaginatum]|nr:hypothetical protein BS78_02G017700 [Paspalum vaginatum]
MSPPRPPPAVPEELVEEVLLRFPPDDPARLVRAALVCRGLVPPRLRPRLPPQVPGVAPRAPRARLLPQLRHSILLRPHRNWPAGASCVSARRLRRGRFPWRKPSLSGIRELPLVPASFRPEDWNGAVLCAAASCDHLGCHRGPFLVVLVGTSGRDMSAFVYSSEAAAWSEPTSAQNQNCGVSPMPECPCGKCTPLPVLAADKCPQV